MLPSAMFATDPRAVAMRTVDLVNVFRSGPSRRDEPPGTEAKFADVLHRYGERTDGALDTAELDRCRLVLAGVADMFEIAEVDAAAAALNTALQRYCGPPRLVRHEGWPWHLHFDEADDAAWHRWIGASAAFALAVLLAGRDTVPWGICAANRCERVFVHDDRGGRRNHCSVTCGTRTRVARHRRLPIAE